MLPASPNARMLVVMGLVEEDPVRALDMLSEGPPTQEAQTILGLLVQVAAQDPSQARSMADSLAERSDRRSSTFLAKLISSWMGRDTEGALNWIAPYRGQLVFDAAYSQLIVQAARTNPRRATQLLEREGLALQLDAVASVASAWAGQDDDTAIQWAAA